VLQQRQQRALAGVQRHRVDEVEQPRLGQRAQLGVDVAAAQRDAQRRLLALIACAMRKAPYTAPGKGTESSTTSGRWRASACSVSLCSVRSTRLGGAASACGQRLEARLAHRQRSA
jgi:hypothetical protein